MRSKLCFIIRNKDYSLLLLYIDQLLPIVVVLNDLKEFS